MLLYEITGHWQLFELMGLCKLALGLDFTNSQSWASTVLHETERSIWWFAYVALDMSANWAGDSLDVRASGGTRFVGERHLQKTQIQKCLYPEGQSPRRTENVGLCGASISRYTVSGSTKKLNIVPTRKRARSSQKLQAQQTTTIN